MGPQLVNVPAQMVQAAENAKSDISKKDAVTDSAVCSSR